jgi:hypothetical protein
MSRLYTVRVSTRSQRTILLLMPLLFGLGALLLGQDASWDLRDYHYYNPYAFLNNRMSFDVAPAQLQTYYNPILYIPFYFMVNYLPPPAVGLLLGTVQGINFILLFAIAQKLIDVAREKFWLCFVVALSGMLGAANLSEIGTVMGDNLVSLLILSSLLLILTYYEDFSSVSLASMGAMCGAGFLAGIAAGLKYTMSIFAVGLVVGCFLIPIKSNRHFRSGSFAIWVLVGFTVAAGFWFYKLYALYGNPILPFFNEVFRAPVIQIGDYRDKRFLPATIIEALFFPVVWLVYPTKTAA